MIQNALLPGTDYQLSIHLNSSEVEMQRKQLTCSNEHGGGDSEYMFFPESLQLTCEAVVCTFAPADFDAHVHKLLSEAKVL